MATGLAILFALLVIAYLFMNLQSITADRWVEISLLVGLVGITAVYAFCTAIQANTSLKMAIEMKEQKYSESLPLLVPDVIRGSIIGNLEPNKVAYQTLQTGVGIEVIWHNLGKGVAINSRFSLWAAPLDSHPGKALYFSPSESTFLVIEGRKEFKIDNVWAGQLYDIPEAHHPRLEAEYQDIYERKITTVQEFRIEEENGSKKAFVGELYFTVNGKRLGEEITSHD